MLKKIATLGVGLAIFSNASQAESVYYYDTLKVKAILDNKDVEAKFRGQKLSNGKNAVSLQGIQMGALDQAQSQIQFELKSSDCTLPVVLAFNPNDRDPQYRVIHVGEWTCP